MFEICELMGWTIDEYLDTEDWMIEKLITYQRAKSKKKEVEWRQQKNSR